MRATKNGFTVLAGVLCSVILPACGGKDESSAGRGAALFPDREPDESIQAAGLSNRVEVSRDEFGVPHIFARTLEDSAFAQGYMHAHDRFFQMDLFRHLIEGRLSEYFGELTLSTDLQNRANMTTTDGRPVYEVMAEQAQGRERTVLDAYAAGVNLYIARIKSGTAPAPVGYETPLLANWSADSIPDWRPADTLAVGRLQEQNLSDSAGEDVARGDAKTKLPPDLFADLVRYQPADTTAVLPEFYDSPFYGANGCTSISQCATSALSAPLGSDLYDGVDFARTLDALRSRDPLGMDFQPSGTQGSNNWVIAKEHTDSGHALVLNDPHLRFYVPPLFYHSQMDTRHYGSSDDDSSVIGITFPGIPGVLIGYNENVAWGATTANYDVTDVYVETLSADGTAVLFNGSYVPLTEVMADFGVLGANGVEMRSQVIEVVPHHGAIIPGSKANGRAMSRKWTGLEPMSSVGAVLDRLSARNVDDFMESMSRFVVGAQNWNGADTLGNTGYMPGARIPVRNDVSGACDPTIPMDGTGPCEWIGTIPANEIPRVKNRSAGYVVTANNDITGTLSDNNPRNDPQYIHSGTADGFRARRITDRVEELMAAGKITKEQMIELQADTVSLEAERLMPFILAARDAPPDVVSSTAALSDAFARLAAWGFSNPSGVDAEYRTDGGPDAAEIDASIAAAIFNTFRPRFYEAIFADERALYMVNVGDEASALYLLENPTTSRTGMAVFDDLTTPDVVETPNDIVRKALQGAVDFLTAKLGADPNAWRWGTIHQVEVQDLFGEFGLPQRALGPFPRGGANSTVDVAGTGSAMDDFTYFSGPQMRFVADVGPDGIVGESSLPGGQIDDPESPHYDDLLPLWLRNETFPYYFKPEDVVAHTEELIVLEPREGR